MGAHRELAPDEEGSRAGKATFVIDRDPPGTNSFTSKECWYGVEECHTAGTSASLQETLVARHECYTTKFLREVEQYCIYEGVGNIFSRFGRAERWKTTKVCIHDPTTMGGCDVGHKRPSI